MSSLMIKMDEDDRGFVEKVAEFIEGLLWGI